MKDIKNYSREELQELYKEAKADYQLAKTGGLKLDMSRGKPGEEQLAISKDLLSLPLWEESLALGSGDPRNYGLLSGLPKAKNFFAELMNVPADQVFVGGNSSLNLMFDLISKAYINGLANSEVPWSKLPVVKFLCPSPGYDRHFIISETFGMEMIAVAMTDQGPDMDKVEELVKDPAVKGMWCIPKYSNPDGVIYSDEVLRRIAGLKPAAADFTVMWDNAYSFHEFDGDFVEFPSLLQMATAAGNPDMVMEYMSTSKITYPGSGVACFACSPGNMDYLTKLITTQTITYDKVNQLRHVLFLKDKANVLELMKKHGAIVKPHFDIVFEKLDRDLAPLGLVRYHKPKGGYFVSVFLEAGTAKRVHTLMKDAGVVMTPAGATYPYGKDPADSNLRIAPTFIPLGELEAAMEVFCKCVKLAALEKLLGV